MDSKNVIWLSSFFALLFITFCVTKHLDDLNPTIVSLPSVEKEPIQTDKVVIDKPTSIEKVTVAQKPQVQAPKERVDILSIDAIATIKPAKNPLKKVLPKQKSKKIKTFILDSSFISAKSIKTMSKKKDINDINKLAFKYGLHPKSMIEIVTKDTKASKKIKEYLIQHQVKAADIKIKAEIYKKNLIKINLLGRK